MSHKHFSISEKLAALHRYVMTTRRRRGNARRVDVKIERNMRQLGPRPEGEGRRRCTSPRLAHNATRVVICRRWVITGLRLRPPASSPSSFAARQTQEDGAHFFASGERDEDSPLEKARPADLIVNHGRQNTRVGKPLSLPSPSPRALIISARRGKRSHKTRSEMARRGPRYVSPSRHEPNSLRDHSLRRRVTIFMRL